MTEKQIRVKRRKLEIEILKRMDIDIRAEANAKKAKEGVKSAFEDLYWLRFQCKHRFPKKKNTSALGRGKCEICGGDDY